MKLFYFQYACTHTTLFSYVSNSLRLGDSMGKERGGKKRMWEVRTSRLFVLITQNVPPKKGGGGGAEQAPEPQGLHSKLESRSTFSRPHLRINSRNIY